MFFIVFNFIRRYWLAVTEVVLLTTIVIQHVEIAHLDNKVAECKLQNAALQDSNVRFAAAVEKQNRAVVKLQTESERKSEESKKSLAEAQKDVKQYAMRAEIFKTWKLSGNECADMFRMLGDYVKYGG